MMRGVLLLCAALLCASLVRAVGVDHETLTWGLNSLTLMPPIGNAPSDEELLTNRQNTVSLSRFYRAGGENAPVTPTECCIAYNEEKLFVVFRCAETDLSFPARDHGNDWYAMLASPSEQDAAFPDKVDLLVSPNLTKPLFYQFAVTLDGRSFGARRHGGTVSDPTEEESGALTNSAEVTGFEAATFRKDKEWIVYLRIPWKCIGGKPATRFGLMPVRTRWREAEVTSPVATDFSDRSPVDLFIETQFSGKARTPRPSECLYRLPSGSLRWQKPAILTYPSAETVRQIWRMQKSLPSPTTPANLSQRVLLTQRWTDLLTLEGFNFRGGSGSIVEEDLLPFVVRRHVNRALRRDDANQACHLLDDYLIKLNKVSRQWFADESPGDIADEEWSAVTDCSGIEEQGQTLLLRCHAGKHPINLHLTLPKTGGFRLYGDTEGYFKPEELLPLSVVKTSNRFSVSSADGSKVWIDQKPFKISFADAAAKIVTEIDPHRLAFRFAPDGRIRGVDFKNRMGTNEVIFGFGEKYDHFNQTGNVLTQWGVDDWTGNTIGLRNQSYKPVPMFHSSKGYSVFINSSYRLRADMGHARTDSYRLTQFGPIFDYYIWPCAPETALQSYTALTGKPLLPPKWAFEPWMGRTGRGWGNTPSHNQVAEQERVVTRFAELDIPHSALYAEGSGSDSPELYDFLAPRGIKVLSWFFCEIPEAEQARLMADIAPGKLAVLDTGGATNLGYVDFTNPNALDVSRQWWKRRLDLGLAGSMVDFGDRVPESAVFYNGTHGDEMHNFYAYDYQRTYNQVFTEKRGDDFILFARAATPGTQKWAAQFAGDHRANFVGLRDVLTGALNLCACGFSTWGSDLGGFLGWAEPAVYMRWTQFACFSPLMRSHGRTPREPWEYGDAAVANYKYYAWVRENLLDYIYQSAVEAHETGIPIMRSMVVAYPRQPKAAGIDDQYLFGNDLLVAPLVTEENSRNIYFPPGRWTGLWDGNVVNGPVEIRMDVPLTNIPVFLREGALVSVKLNRNLEFGHSLSGGSVDALIVTPPGRNSPVSPSKLQREGSAPMLESSAEGFGIKLTAASTVSYLLIYDSAVEEIKLNGKLLAKLPPETKLSQVVGWKWDSSMRRVIVRLPVMDGGQGEERQIEVEAKAH